MHGSNCDREKFKKMQSLSTYRQIVSMTGFKHISNFNRPFKVTVASGDAGVLFRNVKSKLNTNVSSCIRFPLMRATDETPSPSCVHMDVDLLQSDSCAEQSEPLSMAIWHGRQPHHSVVKTLIKYAWRALRWYSQVAWVQHSKSRLLAKRERLLLLLVTKC